MDTELDFLTSLVRRTGESALSCYRAKTVTSELKADYSLVTEADVATDRAIKSAVNEAYPEDFILSEELQPDYEEGTRPVWIVDPIDGTTNFALGLPFWGVSIARAVGGVVEVAAVYFPALGELYSARAGQGATLNGEPAWVKPPREDRPVGFFACCSRTYRRYEVTLGLKPRILGSAAYSLCAVAAGTAVLALETTPKIWDLAAAGLIVTEAGGLIEAFDGEVPLPLRGGIDYRHSSFATLAAASRELAQAAREHILPRHP